MAYTTADLISAIERRAFVPANQSTFSTTEILAIAGEELRSNIFPALINLREEYFVHDKDFTITASTASYAIPERSFNNLLREIKIIVGNTIQDIARIEPEALASTNTGTPQAFYLKDDKIVLHPTPATTANTLRVSYYLTPGDYIETSSAAVISAINTTTNVVSVTSIPASWVTGNTFDFLKYNGGHEYRGVDYLSTLVSGSDITFSSLPTGLAVGDYMALQGYSPLVQMPFGMRSVLAQYTAAALLLYARQPGADEAKAKADELLMKALDAMTPRVAGEDQIITQVWF